MCSEDVKCLEENLYLEKKCVLKKNVSVGETSPEK